MTGTGHTTRRPDHGTRLKAVDIAARLSDGYPSHSESREHIHKQLHVEIKEPIEVMRFKVLYGRTPTPR